MNGQDITDIPFEIEYNDETGTFQLEILHGEIISYQNELQKKEIYINDEKHIIYFYNYNLFLDKEFLLFRFVFMKNNELRKEDLYRLFYIYSCYKPKEIQYNYCSFYFTFKSSKHSLKQIIFDKDAIDVFYNKAKKDFCLHDIKEWSNNKHLEMPLYFDFRYTYVFKDPLVHQFDRDFRIKRIYLSIDSIDTIRCKRLRKYLLLNSMMTIEDTLFDRVTSQIFTSIIINEDIIKEMYNHHIRYVIFLTQEDKDDNKDYLPLEGIDVFTFNCTTLAKLGKIVEFYIKGKSDVIYIFNLNQFLFENMKVDDPFDIQNYDYLYNENPPSLQ